MHVHPQKAVYMSSNFNKICFVERGKWVLLCAMFPDPRPRSRNFWS